MRQVVTLDGAVELPGGVTAGGSFHARGVFMQSPDWWRRFRYLGDRADGLAYQETCGRPGCSNEPQPGRPRIS
jgi:hypothetical protein